ncbi:MAG: hypothetical protein JW855_05035 [Gammaproteobacteria bacterium]|nr:hypothetical protein [Gammaproteobacteria bacterium]
MSFWTKNPNILFEHSASLQSHVDLLKNIKKIHGYKTQMIYLNPPEKIIVKRLSRRDKQDYRHTPLHYMQERKVKIEKLIPVYKNIVDVFVEYNEEDNDCSNFNY